MGGSIEKTWAAILKDVKHCVAQGSADVGIQDTQALARRVGEEVAKPYYPRASWKKLIVQLKVPLQLSTLCKEAYLQHPQQAGLWASTLVLRVFLARAVVGKALQPGTQLCATALQQVQQSGLLQHLAAMMSKEAQELESPQAVDATLDGLGQGGSSSSSSTSSDETHRSTLSMIRGFSILKRADYLLQLFTAVCHCSPAAFQYLSTAAYCAAVRLAMAGLRHISAVLERMQQQQQQQQCTQHWGADAEALFSSMSGALSTAAGRLDIAESANVQLLLSPDFLNGLATALALSALALEARQVSNSTSTGTNRSSSSSSSSIWRPACQLQLELSPAQQQLCEVLGVSSQMLLWAAGSHAFDTADLGPVMKLITAYSGIVAVSSQEAKHLTTSHLMLLVKVDLLLPCFVLRWLDRIPTSSSKWGLLCLMSSAFSGGGLSVRKLWMENRGARERGVAAPAQRDQQQEKQTMQQLLHEPFYEEAAAELVPILIRLCTAWLQQQQLQQKTDSSAAAAPAANSSSRGSEDAGSDVHPLNDFNTVNRWVNLLQRLVHNYPGVLAQTTPSSSCNSSGSSTVSRPVELARDAFLQHAGDMLVVFEGASRCAGMTHTDTIVPTLVTTLCSGELSSRRPAPLLMLARKAGPGSDTQRQLYSMLGSLVKLSGVGVLEERECGRLRYTAAEAAVFLLLAPTASAAEQLFGRGAAALRAHAGGAPVTAASVQNAVRGSAAPAAEASEGAKAAALDVLPCLVIIGRCFLLWAQQLQAEVPLLLQQSADGLQGFLQLAMANLRAGMIFSNKAGQPSAVQQFVLLLVRWLQTGSHSAELSAAGYAPQAVLQQFEQLLAAVRAAQFVSSSGFKQPDAAACAALVKELQSTGLELCTLAVPCMCNNPKCTNMSGLTELATVSGRSCMCGACRVAHYCSRACQRQHWRRHKPTCEALAAAAAAPLAVAQAAGPV